MKIKDKVVLITGGTKGIGKVTADLLSSKGMKVYVTTRKEENVKDNILLLDVTNEELVNQCVNEVIKREGRIDVLVNNAAYGLCGPIVDSTTEEIKELFDTNFFGPHRMIEAVYPIMKKQGYGKIINVSSYAGRLAVPFQGVYSAAKAALSIYSDSLRMEIVSDGIDVCTIEPGDTKTDFHSSRTYTKGFENNENAKRAIEKMHRDEQSGSNPKAVAKKILKAIKSRRSNPRYIVGLQVILVTVVRHIFPRKFQQFLLRKYYGLK
ncbi:MAG: SDR family oxidoreductase [Candidatus Heimdallarchaeum aukensis]|uniref:SDR family oxidoreductase n=1 Tax=Candidatus Heimdallarchaeum aukensis TaxID=2876573 RepID=A0A9Y1FLU4_9ARCH|nr:MAG: SDR family oxidoreductase [Candidatus Heimdallarchaeum aukensis]